MRGFALAILLLAFFTAPVLGVEENLRNITISATNPSEVLAGDSTFFEITATNNFLETDWFSISVYPSDWTTIENGISSFMLGDGGSKTLKIFVSPPADVRAAKYVYTINVQKSSGEKAAKDVVIGVQQRYVSALISDLRLSCTECTGQLTTTARVKNVGNTPITNGILTFSVGNFKKAVIIDNLNQGEEKEFSATFLPATWEPHEYEVFAQLTAGASSDSKTARFSVPSITNFVTDKSEQNTFWGKRVMATVRNVGNVKGPATISSDSSLSPFIALYPDTAGASITGNAVSWYAELKPGESKTVSYSQVFWPTPFIVLLLIFAALYGHSIATALEINKFALGTGKEFGVSIKIKNRGTHADGVVVRDVLPHGFDLVPVFETVKPIIRKISDGTELIWRLGSVGKGEERVLHYRARSGGHGGAIPPAVLRGARSKSIVLRKSNYVVLPKAANAEPTKVKVRVVE